MSKLYISMYHYTRDIVHSRYPQIKGLDTNLFRQQIEYMKNNFNIVTMEQVIDAVEGKSELSEKALLLTFDDGYIIETNYPAFTVPRGFKCRNNREINDTHTNLTTSIYCSKPSSITSPVESKRTELRALR